MLNDILDQLPEYPYNYWHHCQISKNGSIEGNAVISRYPIKNVSCIKLTQINKEFIKQGCFKASILHPRKTIDIFNTQFSKNKGQTLQASEVLDFVDKTDNGRDPQILMGDFKIKRNNKVIGDTFEGDFFVKKQLSKLQDA